MERHTSSLEQALFKRGFLIRKQGDKLALSLGSHEHDKKDLASLLTQLHIQHELPDKPLFANERISQQQQQAILCYPACNHETDTPMSYGSWRNFTRRRHGPKVRTITLDSGIAILVKALSAVGISTVCSCDGHGRRQPSIDFASFHNAVWFEYLQSIYLKEIFLHYKWEIQVRSNGIASLTAVEKPYKVRLLQEDSANMAAMFLHNDEEIRDLKLKFFHTNKKPTSRLLKEKSYVETKEIIMSIIQSYSF